MTYSAVPVRKVIETAKKDLMPFRTQNKIRMDRN